MFCRYCGHELSVAVAPPPEPEEKPLPPPVPEPKPAGPAVDARRDADDDVDIEIVSRPPDLEDDGVDLLDVPTGISTYREEEPKPKAKKETPVDVDEQPADAENKPMVFGGIPVMVDDEPEEPKEKPVEEKPAPVQDRKPAPAAPQPQPSKGPAVMPIFYILGFCVLVVVVALIVNFALRSNSSSYESPIQADGTEYAEQYPEAPSEAAPAAESYEDTRQQALQKFCGSFSMVEEGGSFNYVTELVLDPVNRSCSKVVDNGVGGKIVDITNSIGYYGSEMQMVAYWNILSFNMSDDGRSALVEMIPEFGDDVRRVSKVKLQLDEYGNITVSHVSGSSAPVGAGDHFYFNRD
ncbi:MAG: hypothetical protein IJ527_03395 [Prevotella sp.]|nr:hypothetical protein [Prevotella sp.]